MKQLKSRSQDLRSLFENNITIEYVAEPLKAMPADAEITEVLHWMQAHNFDVIGIKTEDTISGYSRGDGNTVNSL
jgi:hypothetical protein